MSGRRLATSAVLVLAAALTGCGSDSSDDGDKAPEVSALSEPEATTALLTLGNLGGQFQLDEDADHSSPAPGCLEAVDAITDDNDAPVDAVRDFTADTETGFPLVSSQVQSYDSVEDAEQAVADLEEALADCTEVDETDSDGNATALTVSFDDDTSFDGVDEQVNLSAVGSIANAGEEAPLGLWLAVMRIENNLTVLTVGDLAVESPGEIDELVEVVNDRLAAVMDGEQPDEDAVAGE